MNCGDLLALASFFAGISLLAVGGGDARLLQTFSRRQCIRMVAPTQFASLVCVGPARALARHDITSPGLGTSSLGVPGALVAGGWVR